MTPEAQRIAIAEACGWKWQEGTEPTYGGANIPRGWFNPRTKRLSIDLPDFLTDLNAMHKAEKAVIQPDIKLRNEYAAELRCVDMPLTEFFFLHATAAQRCKAFLKTLNLWKE